MSTREDGRRLVKGLRQDPADFNVALGQGLEARSFSVIKSSWRGSRKDAYTVRNCTVLLDRRPFRQDAAGPNG